MTKIYVPKQCPKCKELGQDSNVRKRDKGSTLLGIERFKDELGAHVHNSNTITIYYSCDKGHRFTESYKEPCSNPNCNYNK